MELLAYFALFLHNSIYGSGLYFKFFPAVIKENTFRCRRHIYDIDHFRSSLLHYCSFLKTGHQSTEFSFVSCLGNSRGTREMCVSNTVGTRYV